MKVYDPKTEIALSGLEEFFESFMQSRLHELDLLNLALDTLDYSTVLRLAHQWRGFSVPYGFGKLESFAIQLESGAHAQNSEQCRVILGEITHYLQHKKSSSGQL